LSLLSKDRIWGGERERGEGKGTGNGKRRGEHN